jgi:hypothetical protein
MKLLIFTPCEKVLQDVRSGQSLVNIFHEIKVQLPPNSEFPNDAVLPKEWAIFSKWAMDSEEEEREYESDVRIYWPNGKLWAEQTLQAAQPTKSHLIFMVQFQGFPFGQSGRLRVINSLRSDGVLVGNSELAITVSVSKDMVIPILKKN